MVTFINAYKCLLYFIAGQFFTKYIFRNIGRGPLYVLHRTGVRQCETPTMHARIRTVGRFIYHGRVINLDKPDSPWYRCDPEWLGGFEI